MSDIEIEDFAYVTIRIDRPDGEPGTMLKIALQREVENPDLITDWLNLFQDILHTVGFHYDQVGVSSVINDNGVEHWSDY